jgi:uncharacterized Zn-binding protein involved in type VI secretion
MIKIGDLFDKASVNMLIRGKSAVLSNNTVKGYCKRCQKEQVITHKKEVTVNGVPAIEGQCRKCKQHVVKLKQKEL